MVQQLSASKPLPKTSAGEQAECSTSKRKTKKSTKTQFVHDRWQSAFIWWCGYLQLDLCKSLLSTKTKRTKTKRKRKSRKRRSKRERKSKSTKESTGKSGKAKSGRGTGKSKSGKSKSGKSKSGKSMGKGSTVTPVRVGCKPLYSENRTNNDH